MKSRWLTMTVALISAFAFTMSVQSAAWWTIGEFEIGPFGTKRCDGTGCHAGSLAWLVNDPRFDRVGTAAWAAALIAAVALLLLSARVAAKAVPKLVAKMTLVALATALVAGSAFIVMFPRSFASELGAGLWLWIAALVLGAAAAITVLRR